MTMPLVLLPRWCRCIYLDNKDKRRLVRPEEPDLKNKLLWCRKLTSEHIRLYVEKRVTCRRVFASALDGERSV